MTSRQAAFSPKAHEAPAVDEVDVLVVGSGFAGLYQLQRLRAQGLSVKVYEAAPDLGGVWYWNCYPGARVDSQGAIYQFSAAQLWRGFDYDELYPGYEQVRAYFNHVDAELGLRRDIRFNTPMIAAQFDERVRRWVVRTSTGRIGHARFLVLCTGIGAKPLLPDIPGLEDFAGESHHPALWPQAGVDLRDKRIGVIGTGATGVQVVQECAAVASHLTVFQRTPNMALPMRQRKLDDEAKAALRVDRDALYDKRAETFGGFEFNFVGELSTELSSEELQTVYENLWEMGGFRLWVGGFFDVLLDDEANQVVYKFWRDKVRQRIQDPHLAEKLAPTVAPHPFGAKRPSLEQNYYDVFNQPNVRLVDIKESPIRRIVGEGVLTAADELHELDVLILATGFDMVTGGLTQIDIRGSGGQTLAEQWSDGVDSHLGSAVHGFPNMLFVYGPLSPAGFANGPSAAELHGEQIVAMIDYMDKGGYTRFEATAEADREWREHTDEIANMTVFPRAESWYMGANVPGKKRQSLNYPGGLPMYLAKWAEVRGDGYRGFEIS
jgi:cation diffusion facilitator CzcD-associated flavoprotein CzcO